MGALHSFVSPVAFAACGNGTKAATQPELGEALPEPPTHRDQLTRGLERSIVGLIEACGGLRQPSRRTPTDHFTQRGDSLMTRPQRPSSEQRTAWLFVRSTCLPSLIIAAACALGGCGSDDTAQTIDAPAGDSAALDAATVDASPVDGPPVDGPPLTFTLTSTAITEGGVIPTMHSCQGTNVSPPLVWTGAPPAPGHALIFSDITNDPPFLHSIIRDVPATATSLPENIEKVATPSVPPGSKQPFGYNGSTRGYLGPCPGSMHRYEFALYTVDTYPLPGVTIQSTRFAVRDAIIAHATAHASLTATFTP